MYNIRGLTVLRVTPKIPLSTEARQILYSHPDHNVGGLHVSTAFRQMRCCSE